MRRRVIIIGAGPAGCATALALARARTCEVVLVERRVLPRPKTCAGGLSPWTLVLLDKMGLLGRVMPVAYPIRGALLYTGHGRPLVLHGSLQAAVLERARFDSILLEEALAAGVEVREGLRVTALQRSRDAMSVCTASGEALEGSAVVIAAGAHGREFDRARPPRGAFFGLLVRYEDIAGIGGDLEIFVDDKVLLPHYGWMFPEGPRRANLGVCFTRRGEGPSAHDLLDRLLERHVADRLRHARRIGRVVGHPIDARPWPRALSAEGLLRVGEAAGLVDPWSGEGIYHALVSGHFAGEALAASAGRVDDRARRQYASRIYRAIGPWLLASEVLRRGASTPLLGLSARVLSRAGVAGCLERLYGRRAQR